MVTIYFYNLDGDSRHTFTIDAPYINTDIGSLQNSTITFKADHEGIYQFYCKYHLPTMVGQ